MFDKKISRTKDCVCSEYFSEEDSIKRYLESDKLLYKRSLERKYELDESKKFDIRYIKRINDKKYN